MAGRKGVVFGSVWCLIVLTRLCEVFCTEKMPLSAYIEHYEPLNYDKRETTSILDDAEVRSLNFDAFGRNFKLQLKRDTETFSPGLAKSLNKDAADAVNSAVVGKLDDDKDSEVFGSMKDGKFHGSIYTKDEEFNVKPTEYVFDEPQDFHSVIYRAKDVVNPYLKRDKSDDIVSQFVKRHRSRRESAEFDTPDTFDLFTQKENKNLMICNISLEADYLFTEAMANDTGRAIGEMVYLVRVANKKFEEMFKTKEWGKTYQIRMMVGRVMAYSYSTTPEPLRTPSMGVSTFLDHVSDLNYDGFCQAFFFTYRDFEGGITGLSWPKYGKDAGGICEPRRYIVRIFENYSVQKLKSFNTGVITYKFYGTYIPPKMGELAFLRQVGTAFGARDDPETDECMPGLLDGNYIMYNKASNGGRKNNDQFSPCSIRDIVKIVTSPIVRRPINTDRLNPIHCMELPESFIERRSKCGDSVRHYKEQCDCGSEEECRLKEPGRCCIPKTCTLRAGASCSINDGPCCDTTTCSHRPANYVCRPGDECAFDATCNNLRGFDNYQCPARVKKGDFKPCEDYSQVCMDGICSNSVCRRYDLKECQCMQKDVQCYVCCMFLDKCVAAVNIPVVTGFRKGTLPIGAPCANNTGYCDIFHVCQTVDLQLPMEKVYELYYKREDVRTLTRKYWWGILLGTLAWITFIILLVYCINKRTRSSIPKTVPRMQMSLLQQQDL